MSAIIDLYPVLFSPSDKKNIWGTSVHMVATSNKDRNARTRLKVCAAGHGLHSSELAAALISRLQCL